MSKTSFNGKSIGAEDETGIENLEDIICQTLEVATSANFLGSVFFTTLELNSIGSYQQTGNVDFNNNEMSNINIVSGNIDGINIGSSSQGSGKFTSLQSGVSGTGYQVYFYSDNNNNYFNYDGDNGILKVTNKSTFGITNPFGFFQVSPVKYSRGKVQISDNQTNPGPGKTVVGNNDVTFPTDIVGYYLVLADNTKTKIVERLSDKLLTCDGPDSNGNDILKSEQDYNIYYPGIIIDDDGNLNAGGTGHLTIPSGNTASRSTSATIGSMRYNTEQSLFEGYTGNKWSSIGGSGSQDNQTKLLFDKFVNDNKVRLLTQNKDSLIIENNGKLKLGYINTYGHLKTSTNKSIINENNLSSDLIEEYNINVNSELVDQNSNEYGLVGTVTNTDLTLTTSSSWGSLSSNAPLYSSNGVPFRLYRNNTSSFDLYGSQSETIGYENSFYNNLTFSGSNLQINDITIDASNYNNTKHKEYSIKISSVYGLNDLTINSTSISSDVTLEVSITDVDSIDKFRIKIVGENNFSTVQTNTGQNLSLNIIRPSTSTSIGNINLSFANTTGHVINEIWTIVISNTAISSMAFSNPNIGSDKFVWKEISDPNSTYSSENSVSKQNTTFNDGIQIKFGAITGHTLNSEWTFKVYSKNRITATNNSDTITSNDNIKNILNIDDSITIYNNNYKYTYLVKEFISENDSEQIYKVRLNKNFVGASGTTYKALYDANLISLYNGYGKTKFRVDKSGNIGVLTGFNDKIKTSLYLNSNDAIKIPVGTTAQRPSTNETGYIRYNDTTKNIELYDQNKYVNINTNGAIISPNLKNKAYITDTNNFIIKMDTTEIMNISEDNISIGVSTSYSKLTDGTTVLSGGSITNSKYIQTEIGSITKNLSVGTLTDGVLTIESGTISNAKEVHIEIASITKNLSVGTLTDGVLTMVNGTITNISDIKTNVASVTKNFSVGTLTDGVLTMESGTITNVSDIKTNIASVTKNFSASTLTDGILTIESGTITNVSDIKTNIASVTKNFSASTLTDGILTIESGTITNVSDIKTNVASVTKNFSIGTLTDGVLTIESGTITNVSDIKTNIASVTKNFSIGTLTDGVLTIESGTITNVSDIKTNVASITKNLSVGTLTDGVLTIESGTISNTKLLVSEELNISGDATISGNLAVAGSFTVIHTDVSTSEQISVTNDGTGPALIVKQRGYQPVVNIMDTNAGISNNGVDVVKTNGSSTTVNITNNTDYNNILVDSEIAANNIIRNVLSKDGNNNITVDSAVNWDNSGAGFSFTYKLPIHAFFIKDGGLVGIGTSNPSNNLEVIGTSLLHTLTDGILTIKNGTITNVSYIKTEVASVTKNFSVGTLTDGILTMENGTITNVSYIKTEVGSITKNLSISTLTDGILEIQNGSITSVKYINVEIASVTSNFSANKFYGDGSNLTGLNADKIIKNDTEIVVEDTGSNGHAKFIFDGNEKVRIDNNGNVGIGLSNPSVSLDINATDAISLPSGGTSDRPSNPKTGMLRYNSTSNELEVYKSSAWDSVGGSGGGGGNTQVGNPSSGTFSSLGYGSENPQITSTNVIPDAFQILDRWIARFLVDTPPPPTLVSTSTTSTKISINWTNPIQFEVGILNTKVPKINEIKIDYKKSSNSSWTTINTNNVDITSLEFYIEGSGSGVSGNVYKFYTIDKETNYDFRIYGINDNNERNLQYLTVNNLATVGIGEPSAPSNLSGSVNSDTQVTLSYTKPQYNDSVNNTTSTPYIEKYKATINTTSSNRYGGVLSDSRDVFSSTGNNTNAPTSIVVTNMNPGTTYSFKVAAKNTQNVNYGNYTSTINKTTNFPSAPNYLTTSDANSINNSSTLRGSYQTSGYSMDGITVRSNIFNINNISGGIETVLTSQFRINYDESTTDNIVSIIRAFGGLTNQYNNSNNTSSTNIGGFSIASTVGDYTNGASILTITEDKDYYNTSKYQGFYKICKCKVVADNSNNYYTVSSNSYSLQLQQEVILSGSNNIINTNRIDFYLDSLNSNPVINNLLISDIEITNSSNDIKYISGILTYDTSATFKFQFNLENLGDFNLRSDRKHAYLGLYNSSSLISSGLTIYRYNFSNSGSKYYTEPSNKYETSTVLYNTDGYTLTPKQNRENIQINSFTFNMSNINNIYSENVVIKGTPYNLYGTGSNVSGSTINTTNGNSMGNIRVDGKSIVVLNNSNSSTGTYGLHVRSGYDSGTTFYPSGPGTGNNDFGDNYDNTANISSNNNPRYDKELQLINGYYTSYNTYAYKDYSSYYVSSSVPNSYNYPNYSNIYTNEANNYRFVTFKYTNLISNSNGCRISFVSSSGFSSTMPNDISLHIKINNSGDNSYNTAWLNANDAVSGVGVTDSNKGNNGTTCLSISGSYVSTSTLKYCYLPSPTTGDLYIRLGIKIGSNKSISYISVQNNLS